MGVHLGGVFLVVSQGLPLSRRLFRYPEWHGGPAVRRMWTKGQTRGLDSRCHAFEPIKPLDGYSEPA